MLSIEILDSITHIDRNDWDPLTDGDILASHDWLKTVEECSIPDTRPRYVLIRDDGRPVGATVCQHSMPGDRTLTPDDMLFGGRKRSATRCGLSLLPTLICGAPNGAGHHFLVDPGASPDQRSRILERLLDAVQQVASSEGLSIFLWNVFEDQVEVLDSLERRGFNKTRFFPACYLDVTWSSFDEYVAHLKPFRNMPRNVKNEIKKNQRAGVTIETIEQVGPHQPALHDLANKHWSRHNGMPFPYKRDFFEETKKNLGNRAELYGAFKGSDLVGFMLLLKGTHTGHALEVGIDHDATRGEATYFNLSYYAPIRNTIGTEIKRLYYGRGLPEIKIRRGCQQRAAHLLYRAGNRGRNMMLRPLFALHSLWLQRKIAAQPRAATDGSFSKSPRRPGQ